jgi:hypothetical protein
VNWFWPLIQSLGGVAVIIGAACAAAYGLFRALAERWLDEKFGERLEALKHAQQQEIEQLRGRIAALMDRTTKLHQREYDTLPLLWEKLASANAEVVGFTSSIQSIADVGRMTDAQMEEFLSTSELLGTQREAVRTSTRERRTEVYRKEIYWHRNAKVETTLREFSRYLKFNGIFVLPAIKEKSARLEKLLWDALLEHQTNEQDDVKPRMRESTKLLSQEGPRLSDEIEQLVQERLWMVTELK